MKKQSSGRSLKLIRNILLIILLLIVLWLVQGTPALTKDQAFRRAMREHFLEPKDAEVFFGEDGRISALAEVKEPGGVYVQTGIGRSGLFWEHGLWSESAKINDPDLAGLSSGGPSGTGEGSAYIIPLFAYGQMTDSPEVAVLLPEEIKDQVKTVELVFIFEGESHQLDLVGEQDGWLLFHFEQDVWRGPETGYKTFVRNHEYMKLDTPEGRTGCSFVLMGYDRAGFPAVHVRKDY